MSLIKAILNVPSDNCRHCPYLRSSSDGHFTNYECGIFKVEIFDFKRTQMCKDVEVEE